MYGVYNVILAYDVIAVNRIKVFILTWLKYYVK